MNLKKFFFILLNVFLLFATGGFWILVIIGYLVSKSRRTSLKNSDNGTSFAELPPTPRYSGSKFAQESGKGIVFNYATKNGKHSHDVPYAVIDLETNGLNSRQHRVIEVAVRRITAQGEVIDEISTLINPETDEVGATFIHHIKAEDLADAPIFAEFAPELLKRLSGSIAVAHHAAFEDSFLGAEFGRLGIGVPGIPCIDTLWLTRQVVDLPNYKLKTVLDSFGIQDEDSHTALGDVRNLSKLLPLLLAKSTPLSFSTQIFSYADYVSPSRIKTRVTNLRKGEVGWMGNIVNKLPEYGLEASDEVAAAYTELLSTFLSDGKITGDEAKQLAKLAGASGLGANQVKQLNAMYLDKIESLALADGILSNAEKRELEAIKVQLGL